MFTNSAMAKVRVYIKLKATVLRALAVKGPREMGRVSIGVVVSVAVASTVLMLLASSGSPAQSTAVATDACGLCVTAPRGVSLSLTDSSRVTVTGGSVDVASNGSPAVSMAGSSRIAVGGRVRAGGTLVRGGSSSVMGPVFAPVPGLAVVDAFAGRPPLPSFGSNLSTLDYVGVSSSSVPPRPDGLYRDVKLSGSGTFVLPDGHRYRDVSVGGSAKATLKPGLYRSLAVSGSAKVTLVPGRYVVTDSISTVGSAGISGTGASLVFACNTGDGGARACANEKGGKLTMTVSSSLVLAGNSSAVPSISYVPGNTSELFLDGSAKVTLASSGIDAGSVVARVNGSSVLATGGSVFVGGLIVSGSSSVIVSAPTQPPTTTTTATTSTTTTTTTTIPESFPISGLLNEPRLSGPTTPLKTAEEFFGFTAPKASFTVVGAEAAAGVSVSVQLSEPMPPEIVTIEPVFDEFFRPGVAASEVFEFSLVGDQSILTSATIKLPYRSADVLPGDVDSLWVAYQDEESGAWVPEENAPTVDPVAKTVTVVTAHFSKRVVFKSRPIDGAWSNSFLDAMFGPFPAQCVPATTSGTLPAGKVAFLFDSSGSMADGGLDLQAVGIAQKAVSALRPIDRVAVYYSDGGQRVGGFVSGSRSAVFAKLREAGDAFGSNMSPINGGVKELLELAETDLASPDLVLREVFLFTDRSGARELFLPDSPLFGAGSGLNVGFGGPGSAEELARLGIRLTLFLWDETGIGPWEVNDLTGNPYVSVVRPVQGTADAVAAALRVRLRSLTDYGTDSDSDGLTDCEEQNLFFPNPNFPGGSTRNQIDALSVFFSHTLSVGPTAKDTDEDGTNDGAEIARRKLSAKPVLAKAFANLISQGVNNYFVAVTGRPDSADTDGDSLKDPASPEKFETCGSGDPSPLKADTDDDGRLDALECAEGTSPNKNQFTSVENSWALDYVSAQNQMNGTLKWRGARASQGFASFETSPAMAKLGRVRIVAFIPQDETATAPCYKNITFSGVEPLAGTTGTASLDECNGFLGDDRPYSANYDQHKTRYLQFNRMVADVDFRTGVWGVFVHPTCERGRANSDLGACYDTFPIRVGDLQGLFRRFTVNFAGRQDAQLFDVRSEGGVFTFQGKVVQNATGLVNDPVRPAVDFRITLKPGAETNTFKIDADGFPAMEIFWVRPNGVKENLFNTESLVGKAPSPLAMTVDELIFAFPLFFAQCDQYGFVRTTAGCVPLGYIVNRNFR
jgi:hypothetical protein